MAGFDDEHFSSVKVITLVRLFDSYPRIWWQMRYLLLQMLVLRATLLLTLQLLLGILDSYFCQFSRKVVYLH